MNTMEHEIDYKVENMTVASSEAKDVQKEPLYLTMSAKSTITIDTKILKKNNDCETMNKTKSEQAKGENAGDKRICENEVSKRRSSWNTQIIILFVGMICILPIFSLIGVFTLISMTPS